MSDGGVSDGGCLMGVCLVGVCLIGWVSDGSVSDGSVSDGGVSERFNVNCNCRFLDVSANLIGQYGIVHKTGSSRKSSISRSTFQWQ